MVTQKSKSHLFPVALAKSKCHSRRRKKQLPCYWYYLNIQRNRPILHSRPSQLTHFVSSTELSPPPYIPPSVFPIVELALVLSTHQIEDRSVQQLQTANKLPMFVNELILLHLRLGKLSIGIWFGVAPHLAAKIRLGISFIDCVVRTIFLVERKVAPWHSKPNAIPSRKRTLQNMRI